MTLDLLRFTTAGSVDDGKSTLIGRLLYDTKQVFEDQLEHVALASERRGGSGALDLALLTDGLAPKLAHIIPNFQNPAGYTLSQDKRDALLALAQEHGFTIFEDDPYVALRFTGETLPTMLSMDAEHVVYASSFSKTVCPGIRVGYLVGPPDLIGAIAQLATNTYISPNMVAQSIVYEFCASGAIERSIETVKAALRERLQLAFGTEAQLRVSEIEPHGVRAELSFPARKALA